MLDPKRYDSDPLTNPENWNDYFCVFIDILGQQKNLDNFKFIKDLNKQNQKQFEEYTIATIGNVALLRNSFSKSFYEAKEQTQGRVGNIFHFTKEETKELDKYDIKFLTLSDSIVIYTPIFKGNKICPYMPVLLILNAICVTILALQRLQNELFPNGLFLRGGISYGSGTTCFPSLNFDTSKEHLIEEIPSFYGYALSKAYLIESKEADYPRIVISEEFVTYINQQKEFHEREDTSKYKKINIEHIDIIQKLIAKDSDGKYILDYLSDQAKLIIDENFDEIILKALENINFNIDKYKDKKKIRTKYTKLKKFFLISDKQKKTITHLIEKKANSRKKKILQIRSKFRKKFDLKQYLYLPKQKFREALDWLKNYES